MRDTITALASSFEISQTIVRARARHYQCKIAYYT